MQIKKHAKVFIKTIKLTKFLNFKCPDIAFEVRKLSPKYFDKAYTIGKRMELAFNFINKEIIIKVSKSQNNDLCTNRLEFSKN